MRSLIHPRFTSALFGLTLTATLGAQGVLDTPDAWRLSAGWQFTSLDTQVSMTGNKGISAGVKLDFENTFNVPVQKQAWFFDASWRYKPRHILDFGYQSFHRVGGRDVDANFDFGGYHFEGTGQIQATFKSDFPYLGYRYGFYQGGDLEMSVGGGVTYLTLGAGLDTTAVAVNPIDPGTTAPYSGHLYEEFSVPAPLIAFQIDGRLAKNWFMSGYIRPIFYKSSDFKGAILIWGINGTWNFSRNAGLTMGIERTQITAKDVSTGDYKANFLYSIIGAKVAATFRF